MLKMLANIDILAAKRIRGRGESNDEMHRLIYAVVIVDIYVHNIFIMMGLTPSQFDNNNINMDYGHTGLSGYIVNH